MVQICSNTYPVEREAEYKDYFETYSFPLSPFQKYAIEAIVTGNHILVTAHTGSGKTLPAEFAIEYFTQRKKKVIYTSPIKALSNQKFWEFSKKFPDISFGILTGDIKTNPDADVLIMTTEILQNTLFRRIETEGDASSSKNKFSLFDMDIDNELGCVIFDEVHYINDADRGKVWEETIMLLPLHIQMVMLSATLDKPERFAQWCEGRVEKSKGKYVGEMTVEESHKKSVYLTTTYERVVPLTHYSFITATQAIFKIIKDKELEKQIRDQTNRLVVLQTARGEFNEPGYHRTASVVQLLETKRVFIKRSHVLNQVTRHMVENAMLPAICFILSRKQLEIAAHEVTTILLEDDSKVPYIVARECEQIIRKLPNYSEYLGLPEYNNLVHLLEKGIAIHHAGMMPVLREMVELLFAKGYVKLLFATETFAVGINMPTKTVLFTDVQKFDGSGSRLLHSHEFTQMAGRAGRRGIDTVGNVIHLTNLFKKVGLTEYRQMMRGKPQTLVSKFRISYSLMLNLAEGGPEIRETFVEQSMCQTELEDQETSIRNNLEELEKEKNRLLESFEKSGLPIKEVQQYIEYKKERITAVNKRRKDLDREMESINSEYKNIDSLCGSVEKYNALSLDIEKEKDNLENTESYFKEQMNTVLYFLEQHGFVKEGLRTIKGYIATHLREVQCLAMAEQIAENRLDDLSVEELMALFSCFTQVTVPEDFRSLGTNVKKLEPVLGSIAALFDDYERFETEKGIFTGDEMKIQYDLIDTIIQWSKAETMEECKYVLFKLEETKGVYLGEFVKACMKINNIATEIEKVAEYIGNVSLLQKLREIPDKIQKYVATNQSLYV
jgi:superfamily II RNA helicase